MPKPLTPKQLEFKGQFDGFVDQLYNLTNQLYNKASEISGDDPNSLNSVIQSSDIDAIQTVFEKVQKLVSRSGIPSNIRPEYNKAIQKIDSLIKEMRAGLHTLSNYKMRGLLSSANYFSSNLSKTDPVQFLPALGLLSGALN